MKYLQIQSNKKNFSPINGMEMKTLIWHEKKEKYVPFQFMLTFLIFLLLLSFQVLAQTPSFKVVPLGVKGGSDESNLSSYMVAPVNSNNYVCLDAGTLYAGIREAIKRGVFSKSIEEVLRENIKGYLISHAHLDHVAGLILNSPDDTSKNIYAMKRTIDILKNNYFTWQSWANFANEGEKPRLDKYRYVQLDTGREFPISNTEMTVTPFILSHGNPYKSAAFLIRYQDHYLLYLGDTGPDKIEHSDDLKSLWKSVAPLIRNKQLKVIFIETSFSDEQPDNKLFGHLTPKWLMEEMNVLSAYTGKSTLINFPIVITHAKPPIHNEQLINKELISSNRLKLRLIFPEQGKMMEF